MDLCFHLYFINLGTNLLDHCSSFCVDGTSNFLASFLTRGISPQLQVTHHIPKHNSTEESLVATMVCRSQPSLPDLTLVSTPQSFLSLHQFPVSSLILWGPVTYSLLFSGPWRTAASPLTLTCAGSQWDWGCQLNEESGVRLQIQTQKNALQCSCCFLFSFLMYRILRLR